VFLWLQTEPERVGRALGVLADERTELFFSAASAWEIAIKYGLGRLPLPEPPQNYVPSRIQAIGATTLAVDHIDAVGVTNLPNHHRDPFDRMLVSQARRHAFTLVTGDDALLRYDVDHLRVP
jgi:PIN domain nuclease of toxin-antitoxin system